VWTVVFKSGKRRALVWSVASRESEARRMIEKALPLSARKLAAATNAALGRRATFTLNTSDDRTNQVFALLASALIGAGSRTQPLTRTQIEETSQLAEGLFLASRERPSAVFPDSSLLPAGKSWEQLRRDNLRWGSAAYRAVLAYGMADPDTLRQITLEILAGLSRLQAEYVTSDVEVLADESIRDPYMRQAVAHVRLAALMGLGEDICLARGDHEAQGAFRVESLRAGRRAYRLFERSAKRYEDAQSFEEEPLTSLLDTTAAEPEDLESAALLQSDTYPDTVLMLAAGARYGFNWLQENPAKLWDPRLAVGGFVWQRWVNYRFRSDLKITETPDFDSLCTLVLQGPVPGVLTQDPSLAGEPSLPVMAAAFQNLVELYLGVRPDGFEHRVHVEPRLPSSWGHTSARVPFLSGRLEVECDFAHNWAIIGMSGIPREVKVYFGYPLLEGGFVRAQFALSPGHHPMRIDYRVDKDNRARLSVSEVP
jgi:hypothetical protein